MKPDPEVQTAMLALRDGRYDEALASLLAVFTRAEDTHFIVMVGWRQLVELYAPARAAMVRERDEQVSLLLAGDLTFGKEYDGKPRDRLGVILDMNETLKDSRATYDLFLQLLVIQAELSPWFAWRALPAIVEVGDYALAERYIRNPLSRLPQLNKLAEKLPLIPSAQEAPRLAAELSNFVRDVSLCAAVWRGLGRDREADALQSTAVAGLANDQMRALALRELAGQGAINREIVAANMRAEAACNHIDIRVTNEEDWRELKRVRLAALLDAPTAFGVTHAAAAAYPAEAWRDRAAGRGKARFILAFDGDQAVGIVGCVPNEQEDLELIAMWVEPRLRGTPTAARLVDAVKAQVHGHGRLLLDVSPSNARAAAFYQKQGFTFLPQWEPLESHPHIQLQKMAWRPQSPT